MKKISLAILLLASLPLLAGISSGFYGNPAFSFDSLINPNLIKMQHSLSFQSGLNSQGNGYYLNMYTNHLNFALHPKLDFNLDLHFVNHGSMNMDKSWQISGNNDNSSQVIPEFEMLWRPNENMKISFGLQRGNSRSLFPYTSDSLFDD